MFCTSINIRPLGIVAVILLAPLLASAQENPPPTFNANVADIVERRCAICHYDGGIGPMSLASYGEVKNWSRMIREVVSEGRMPPWHADGRYGVFSNDRRFTKEEYDTLIAWLDAGMPEGDGTRFATPSRPQTWRIGQPDQIFSMPETAQIPATGVVPYHYYETPTNFQSNRWVKAVEVRPGNAKVVHHILVYIRSPKQLASERDALGLGHGLLEGYAPGNQPSILEPDVALHIPAGATLIWQVHYTPTGKPETDRSQLGLKFANEIPRYEHKWGHALNARFTIPARTSNYTVRSQFTFPADAWLTSLTPHMHLRGKAFSYEARYPNGAREILLSVPKYDFNWQTSYELAQAKPMPRGTQIHCTASFDNSAKNPYNPNPNTPVRWGQQTWHEMMIGWFSFVWEPTAR